MTASIGPAQTISVAVIRTDGGAQPRAELRDETVVGRSRAVGCTGTQSTRLKTRAGLASRTRHPKSGEKETGMTINIDPNEILIRAARNGLARAKVSEIARRANVSSSSVANVLRDRKKVASAETAARVLEVIGFEPHEIESMVAT
ncbi:LacI family DNA-binding transcriptional regulator [bacterium AH-315-N03]|nr:LacI family DNA-binding transcriptional regulator [bacterium AH-315-N03]